MIEYSKYVFYICIGLIISGDDRYDHSDTQLIRLVNQINGAHFACYVKDWFAQARTEQVEVNPYWPRGSALAVACFFIDDMYRFDHKTFTCFIAHTASFSDLKEDVEFRLWILELPNILQSIDANLSTALLWQEYCRIGHMRFPHWSKKLANTISIARSFFGEGMPELVFSPQLFAPDVADFVQLGNRIITIASDLDAETMLHETMHAAIAPYRKLITKFAETFGIDAFAAKEQMTRYGYLKDESATSMAYVIEECLVRAFAAVLAGSGHDRLQLHATYGFTAVPFIALHFQQLKPTIDTLGTFIAFLFDESANRSISAEKISI